MKFPSFDLNGRVALVTGGGSGIGKAISLSLAHFGVSVAVVDKNLKNAEKVVGEIKQMGAKAIATEADVSNLQQIAEMVNKVVKAFGGIDILVNSAGTLQKEESAENLTPENWDKTLSLNLRGLFFCSQAVGRVMIKQQRSGKIINIASTAAFYALPGTPAYTSSKGGIVALTRALAIEWAKYRINVNAVAPGFTRTPMIDDFMADKTWRQFLNHRMPLGIGEPEDVAGAIVFLASPASNQITGHTIPVDGGYTAGETGP